MYDCNSTCVIYFNSNHGKVWTQAKIWKSDHSYLLLKECAQKVIDRLLQLFRFLDILVEYGNFNVDGTGEGVEAAVMEVCGKIPVGSPPPELESPDLYAEARLGGDVAPAIKEVYRLILAVFHLNTSYIYTLTNPKS